MRKKNVEMRGDGDEEFNPAEPKKELEDYEQVFTQNTEFFSSFNPDLIEESFL